MSNEEVIHLLGKTKNVLKHVNMRGMCYVMSIVLNYSEKQQRALLKLLWEHMPDKVDGYLGTWLSYPETLKEDGPLDVHWFCITNTEARINLINKTIKHLQGEQ